MKSKPKFESCAVECPIAIDFLDLGDVERVVEEALVKEPKKKLGKT